MSVKKASVNLIVKVELPNLSWVVVDLVLEQHNDLRHNGGALAVDSISVFREIRSERSRILCQNQSNEIIGLDFIFTVFTK